MRIAVISCGKYSDAWTPFFELLKRFWEFNPFETFLVTDDLPFVPDYPNLKIASYPGNWCGILAQFCREFWTEPLLVFQEDFFLTAPVNFPLVMEGLHLLTTLPQVGCVRLYPCPGTFGENPRTGSKHFGFWERGWSYFVSCQAGIWDPVYLRLIAEHSERGTAESFEIDGGRWAVTQPWLTLAYREDLPERPLQYLCSGISGGRWNLDSKKLCGLYGIENDWTKRPFM